MDFIIESSAKDKKIYVYRDEEEKKLIACLDNDLILEKPLSLPLKVEIRDVSKIKNFPFGWEKGKLLGILEVFHPQKERVTLLNKKKREVVKFSGDKDFLEFEGRGWKKTLSLSGKKKKFKKIEKREDLPETPEIQGMVAAYLFDKERVYCSENNGEIEGLVRDADDWLEFLPLVAQERVAKQEMVKKLLT